MTQLWWNSNSTSHASYQIYILSLKMISQSMLKQEQSETAQYARMPEPVNALLSYIGLYFECKVGQNDLIPVKCELNISCNLLSIHTNSQGGISKNIWTIILKSTGSRGSLYKCVYKIWRIYLNWWGHECRRRPYLCLPRTPLTGNKS